jgi:L,D-transpeptidase-like protein
MPRRLPTALSRRSVIGLLGLGAVLLNARGRSAQAQSTPGADPDFASLQPGQFIWHPARAPKGPVAIIVSIPRQLVFVYRNGILIGVSTCSTGKPGHSTPAGVFTILDKAKVHTSATYGEPMPDMEKLTWKGIALHVGDLPGYPDSHGCVHLPPDFADDLYAITQIGTPVILAGGHSDPASIADPGAILGTTAREEIEAKIGGKPIPSLSPEAVMSILVSRADMKNLCAAECRYRRRGCRDHQGPGRADRLQCLRMAGRQCQGLDLGRHGLPCRSDCSHGAEHQCASAHRRRASSDGCDQGSHQARHGAGHHRLAGTA